MRRLTAFLVPPLVLSAAAVCALALTACPEHIPAYALESDDAADAPQEDAGQDALVDAPADAMPDDAGPDAHDAGKRD